MKPATPYPMIVIIPAKNEAKSVTQVIQDIQHYFDGTILVVDDASTDNTAQLAADAGAAVLPLCFSLGAWGAIQTGLRYAVKHGYNTAITMDADGQHEAESIPKLLNQLGNACDVVIGAYPERGSPLRQFAWVFFRKISSINLEDLTSGLRVYNRPAIALLASRAATLLEYQDMGVLMLLNQAGLQIKEVSINMRPRTDGHSRIFSSWWAVGHYMMQTLVLCIGRRKLR
ncbi:glycosyltransferase family 2 protein [Candidatus Albibeggiatoa sp. nov. BB20]|uniref:glycosyltransferase family 2 protein n=1 Tax=Candidatus Albibeggiatoa sp. nov. BB20 TaxID=3162723 RepID=UPI0033655F23